MEGCEAEEACTLLGITAENQRVLLHRARGRIRQAIDALTGAERPAALAAATRRRGDAAANVAHRLAVFARSRCRLAGIARMDWLTRALVVS
jgi:hypothetical protein